MDPNATRPAVFLDRDGVLNRDLGYVHTKAQFEWLPGAVESLRRLVTHHFALIIVTNQSGIGRGMYTEADVQQLHRSILAELATAKVHLDAVYYCPHAPDDGCDCRKPSPGMLLRGAREHRIDLARSWIVGDKLSDIVAGRRAGLRGTILVRTGLSLASQPMSVTSGDPHPDVICEDLSKSVDVILGTEPSQISPNLVAPSNLPATAPQPVWDSMASLR